MDQKRLEKFESRLGEALPDDYRQYLSTAEIVSEGDICIEWSGRVSDIRTVFGFDKGSSSEQLDKLYRLVGDVLPDGAIPIAADWGDNFFVIFLPSRQRPGVYYWDHERDVGDDSVEFVTESFPAFLAGLRPSDET